MSDTDRILATAKAQRTLTDGCQACGYSKVYCRAVTYIEGNEARCCENCGH